MWLVLVEKVFVFIEYVLESVQPEDNQMVQAFFTQTQSTERREKEKSIRRHKLRRLFQGLRRLQKSCRDRDRLLQKIGALKHEAGRAARFVEITLPPSGSKVTPKNFRFKLKVDAFKKAERRQTAAVDQPC